MAQARSLPRRESSRRLPRNRTRFHRRPDSPKRAPSSSRSKLPAREVLNRARPISRYCGASAFLSEWMPSTWPGCRANPSLRGPPLRSATAGFPPFLRTSPRRPAPVGNFAALDHLTSLAQRPRRALLPPRDRPRIVRRHAAAHLTLLIGTPLVQSQAAQQAVLEVRRAHPGIWPKELAPFALREILFRFHRASQGARHALVRKIGRPDLL